MFYRRYATSFNLVVLLTLSCALTFAAARELQAQPANELRQTERGMAMTNGPQLGINVNPLQPPDTSSPRATIRSFLSLTRKMGEDYQSYMADPGRMGADEIRRVQNNLSLLLDLSELPVSSRRIIGRETVMYLVDILRRVVLPSLENIPDEDAFKDDDEDAKWRVPKTRITIVRIEEGPREGEFLFSKRTVALAPEFHSRIIHRPLQPGFEIENWHLESLQTHGPWIPGELIFALPDSLKIPVLGNPVWKLISVTLLVMLAVTLLIQLNRITRPETGQSRLIAVLRRLLMPALTLLAMNFFDFLVAEEILVFGGLAVLLDNATTIVTYLSFSWALWIVALAMVEAVILSPKIPDESLDADMLRLLARVFGFVGGVGILAYGAQDIGVPVVGLVAGLGVGGLAMALAVRPTLENLIGGLILYIDRPVRVGDYCSFDTTEGIVEKIGIRSTEIRALDRTIVTVPNAALADMQIVNWARCDNMLIQSTIGLRYETTPDQLRYVLVKLREMFIAHPEIEPDTVRVRFVGHEDSCLEISIRVHARTREWNEFYAIREDVMLRVTEIVDDSGTAFAFPSRTLYVATDEGLDESRSRQSETKVQAWRASGSLPFPNTSAAHRERLADTLDYPPEGSPGARRAEVQQREVAEPLSSEPADEPHSDEEKS